MITFTPISSLTCILRCFLGDFLGAPRLASAALALGDPAKVVGIYFRGPLSV